MINDLVTDQRVHRMAETLTREGYTVRLVGRKLRHSMPFSGVGVQSHRFRMLFRRGPLFYAFFNVRLFFYLLKAGRPGLLIAVDLDTLPANFLVARIRRVPLVFDSHEYFTEVPELVQRPCTKKIWEQIEKHIVPRLTHAIAVSDSISQAYTEKYSTPFVTIRNLPRSVIPSHHPEFHDTYTMKYKLIYQGALNMGRGIELMIDAMQWLQDTMLIVVGDGDIRVELQRRVHALKLTDRVGFPGRIPPEKLVRITAQCSLGLSLEEDFGLNYRYALPNKIFDYIQARIPVLCSDLPEMAAVVKRYGVGEVCISRDPQQLAGQLRGMLHDGDARKRWKIHLDRAAAELNWEREEAKLLSVVRSASGETSTRKTPTSGPPTSGPPTSEPPSSGPPSSEKN